MGQLLETIFKDDAEGASFWSESAPEGIDYYFIAGESMDAVIAGYRDLPARLRCFQRLHLVSHEQGAVQDPG